MTVNWSDEYETYFRSRAAVQKTEEWKRAHIAIDALMSAAFEAGYRSAGKTPPDIAGPSTAEMWEYRSDIGAAE